MGGIVERLFREFSLTLAAAILVSLLVSLTLTPMLCARWLKPYQAERDSPCIAGATMLTSGCSATTTAR